MCKTLINVQAFDGPMDGARIVVPVSKDGNPSPVTWVNRTRLPPDLVLWPGDEAPEELAGPLWSKYAVAPYPEHPDDQQPWRYDLVRSQDAEPDFWDWIDNM